MKVLQVISTAGFFGAEAVALNLSTALSELGHEVRLLVIQPANSRCPDVAGRFRAAGLDVDVVACAGRLDAAAIATLARLADEFGPAVVHTHGYKANFYALAARMGRKYALVATCHNWTNKTRALRLYATLDRFVLRRFGYVFCVSRAVQDALCNAGVPRRKTQIVLNGIDVRTLATAEPALQKTGTPTVGMVGRLVREKGFQFVLAAAPAILKNHPRAQFIVVGEGPDRGELFELAVRLGISEHVCFAGMRPDMPGVYRSLDIMVLPSLNEGMPMAVLEAMAAGVPVIASRVGFVSAAIKDGHTGLLIEPGDAAAAGRAIEYLASRPDERLRLARAAQDWAFRHASAKGMAEQYVAHYELVAGVPRPAAVLAV